MSEKGQKRKIYFKKGIININRKGAIMARKHGYLGVYWFASIDAAAQWIKADRHEAPDKSALDEKFAKWLYGENETPKKLTLI